MKRGVGYCENTSCEDYAKGVFLLNHGDTFYCPRCRQLGKVEKERGFYTGNTEIFKEVRVEYNFDPINSVYREIGIVRASAKTNAEYQLEKHRISLVRNPRPTVQAGGFFVGPTKRSASVLAGAVIRPAHPQIDSKSRGDHANPLVVVAFHRLAPIG